MRKVQSNMMTASWQVIVGIAIPYAEVAVVSSRRVLGELVKRAAGLVEVGEMVVRDRGFGFALTDPRGVGDEPRPGVGLEAGRTEGGDFVERQA